MHSQDDARLDAALDELKDDAAESPQRLRNEIMGEVWRQPALARGAGSDGGSMTKKTMFGLAAVAATLFLILSVTGFPPDLSGVQGTIGQAKRYTAPQVAAGDAAIGDPAVQQFIQSETFAALLKDKDAMKALSDPQMREALANEELIAAVYPGCKLRPGTGPHDSLISIERARKLIGYDPKWTWRKVLNRT